MILSADDEPGTPSPRLVTLALDAIREAHRVSVAEVTARLAHAPYVTEVWPGESYKLLAGFMKALSPKRIIEIGTGGGTSTLSMRLHAPEAAVATFDIVPWTAYEGTLLRAADFDDGKLVQYTDDVSQPAGFERHRALFEQADFWFIDGAKDGAMEPALLRLLETVAFRQPPIMLFDDTRVWTMLGTWRAIARPKLDLTSFGHWTGTGLVEWIPASSPTAAHPVMAEPARRYTA